MDPNASGRGQALRDHMRNFLDSIGVACRWEFEIAAMLSSIGYVTVPQSVMQRGNTGQVLSSPAMDVWDWIMIVITPKTAARIKNGIFSKNSLPVNFRPRR